MELTVDQTKPTEVGVIPRDWNVIKLGDAIEFTGGSQPPRSTFIFHPKTGYIRLLQIRDYKTDKFRTYIPEDQARKKCTENDIMIGRYGPPIFQILRGLSGAYNVALIKANPKGVEKSFAYYVLKQEKLFKFIEKLSQRSSGQTGVDLEQLKGYQIPLPPTLHEQQAIATALSDMDALIEKLEKLIQKKQHIKTAAMQELLKPKEGWETRTIEECAVCLDNLRIPLNEREREHMRGNIPYCGANGIVDYVNDYVIDDDIILMAEDGGYFDEYKFRPIAYRISGKAWINNHAHILQAKDNYNQDFLFYNLVHKNILPYLASGTRAKLNKSELLKIEINFPPTKQQQNLIATILDDIDQEIQSLNLKIFKYQQIKQGMMQELLTGKTRLV